MLLSAVSVLVVAQSSPEIPEGLMNNPVYRTLLSTTLHADLVCYCTQVSQYWWNEPTIVTGLAADIPTQSH